jgi:GNAT superfamily N-acetyltransferase
MFEIDEIHPPLTLDGPGGAEFIEAAELKNTLEREGYGTDELSFTPAESLPGWHNAAAPARMFVIRADGRLAARMVYSRLRDDTTGTAWLGGGVLPEFRNVGMGSALYAHIENVIRADGGQRILVYAVSPEAPGERLLAPTGFGSVPAESPGVLFLLSHGFTLEQVERGSRLALPAAVSPVTADGYRVHTWVGRTPEEWVEDIALLITRMSTDAPSAGLDEPLDEWDVQRVREWEAREASGNRRQLLAAVEHEATGHLVGFTVLSAPAERHRPISQEETLVLSEHRGHRLGMVLKVANLVHAQEVAPGHPAILTFNAEENRHMLSVNEAVGFVPIGYEGAWKKVL